VFSIFSQQKACIEGTPRAKSIKKRITDHGGMAMCERCVISKDIPRMTSFWWYTMG
jgi:hypothetical protein